MTSSSPSWLDGGCHCRAVRFRVRVDRFEAVRCNCTICTMRADLQAIVPPSCFELRSGADRLGLYRFNTGVAKHRFCTTCGIHVFNHPRSHPDFVAVNIRCLDGDHASRFAIHDFDGQNWERSIASLRARDPR